MKIAAAEAQWDTCQPCSFSVFQIGGGNNDQTPTKIIEIPHLLSLLATGTWDGQVRRPQRAPGAVRAAVRPGDYVPNVFIQYWSMRVMAYLGVAAAAARASGACWLIWRDEARDVAVVPVGRDLGRACCRS